jgi:hypothetical protein
MSEGATTTTAWTATELQRVFASTDRAFEARLRGIGYLR